MESNEQQITTMIQKGEGLTLEFKECQTALSRSVYETVCAFLNRHGGTLLLGVNDSGAVKGVDLDGIAQVKKDFVTAINNAQKLNPACYLSVDEISIGNKTILKIYIPESSQVHRCNGRIYDRNEDGDLDITDHTRLVADLYRRKQATYSENKLFPRIDMKALRTDLIEKCRKIARVNTRNHPWANMDDLQLLQSAQLFQTDPLTQESGVTLAGILLFGTDSLILTVCPAHRTDLILRKVNVDRYDDRDLVRTNLIDSYDRILAFVQKHLPDPFYLDGIERVSLRDVIFHEVASNMLIHREYISGVPARLIIEYGKVCTENANRPHGFGILNPVTFAPFPKNPVLGAFFREIHRADELGSGMRKMMRYGKAYGGADPQLIEGDIFRMIVRVPEFNATGKEASTPQVTPQVIRLLEVCTGELLREALQEALGLSDRKHFRIEYLHPAQEAGLIEMTIPEKPRSSKQKYRLTEKGQTLLEGLTQGRQ